MSNLTFTEVSGITDWIVQKLGYPVVTVELSASQLTYAVNEAIERHSAIITEWTIENNIAQQFGLSSMQEFTRKFVARDLDFATKFSQVYSQQAGVGGLVQFRRDYITLSAGTQYYYIPSGRVVSEIFWQEPASLIQYDANYLTNEDFWVAQEFGWALYGFGLSYLTPMYYYIQLSQAFEMRQRLRKGTKTYRITAGPSGQSEVFLSPIPQENEVGTRIWYFYVTDQDLNEKYSGLTSGLYVTDPSTIDYREIPYSAFNSSAQRWVKDASLAIAKEILGRIRGKFSQLEIPDASVTLDAASLLEESKSELEKLKEELLARLAKINYTQILEQEASAAEMVNKSLSYNPMGIFVY